LKSFSSEWKTLCCLGALVFVLGALCATVTPDQPAAILSNDALAGRIDPHDVFFDQARAGAIDRPDVAFAVQEELTAQGFDAGPLDGVAAGRTRRAIRAYRGFVGAPGDDHITRDLILLLHEKP